jgi:hypothetical protein
LGLRAGLGGVKPENEVRRKPNQNHQLIRVRVRVRVQLKVRVRVRGSMTPIDNNKNREVIRVNWGVGVRGVVWSLGLGVRG